MNLDLRRLSHYLTSTLYCLDEVPREASMCGGALSTIGRRDIVDYYTRLEKRDIPSFATIYCLSPLKNDNCPVGICPNPDIDGLLVRIANYVMAFCLTILIFHAPKRVKNVFYYQILNVYALLITCLVPLFRGNITRLHASVATFLATSPVLIYFLVYSIRAFWGQHRLDTVLGRERYLNRGLVFFAAGMWIYILIFTSLGSTRDYFAQGSCYTATPQETLVYTPIYVLMFTGGISVWLWPVSIVVARKEIWPPGESYKPKFATVWKTIGRRYPFVFFISVGMTLLTLWIFAIELALAPNDGPQVFSITSGQIFAVLIVVPPFLQVCQIVPQLWPWVTNLAWVLRCCGRRHLRDKSAKIPKQVFETEGSVDLENPTVRESESGQSHEGEREFKASSAPKIKPGL